MRSPLVKYQMFLYIYNQLFLNIRTFHFFLVTIDEIVEEVIEAMKWIVDFAADRKSRLDYLLLQGFTSHLPKVNNRPYPGNDRNYL